MEEDVMLCRCSPEGIAKCDAQLERAYVLVGGKSDELVARKVDATNFLSQAVMWLNWEHDAGIDWVGCDMWFGVSAKTHKSIEEQRSVTVQCDALEDGLAYIVEWFAGVTESQAVPA